MILQYSHMTLQYSHMALQYSHMILQYSHMTLQYSHMTLQYSHMTLQYSHMTLQYSHIMHTTHTIMLAIAMETVYKRLHLASRKIVWIQRKILELGVKRRYELLSALLPSPSSLYVCRQ